jgi:hypothetical protein
VFDGTMVVGVAVAALPLSRARHLLSRPSPSIEQRERARDDAAQQVRESLEQLGGGLADQAQARMVSAMLPSADGVLETGEDVLQASEELLDDMVDSVPRRQRGRTGDRLRADTGPLRRPGGDDGVQGRVIRAGIVIQGPPSSTWNSSGRAASSASGSRRCGQW